jgi:hypothetical protein
LILENIKNKKIEKIPESDLNKNFYYESIFYNGKYYSGTIKNGIASLCNDPINPCNISLKVKINKQGKKISNENESTGTILIEGNIIKKEPNKLIKSFKIK